MDSDIFSESLLIAGRSVLLIISRFITKFKIHFNMTDDELLKYYYDKNPYDRLKSDKIFIKLSKCRYLYLAPKWMTGYEDDEFLKRGDFNKFLKRLGINKQLYYDILVLKLKSISERPKCNCGNLLEFYGNGYRRYCSISCGSKDRTEEQKIEAGKRLHKNPVSEETRRKMSESHKGHPAYPNQVAAVKRMNATKVVSQSTKDKISKIVSKRFSDPKEREKSSKVMIDYCNSHPEFLDNFIASGVYNSKRGYMNISKCDFRIFYMSSWEEDFFNKCDSLNEVVLIKKPPRIPYEYEGRTKIYVPDSLVILNDGTEVIIEIKPVHFLMDDKVVAKRLSAIKYCRDNNYRLVTLTNYGIYDKDFCISRYL